MSEIILEEYKVLKTALRHFRRKHDELLARTTNGASFELWLNCEFVRACQGAKLIAVNEVGYATFLEEEEETEYPSRHHADILLINPQTRNHWVIESTLVSAATQAKWKNKIVADADKLRRIRRPRTRKFILIFCTSDWQHVVHDRPGGAWDRWFDSIIGKCTSPDDECLVEMPLGSAGQFALKLWEVTNVRV